MISAYAASLSRIAGWALVSAIVIRRSVEAFAVIALVRGTIGILNYAALGLLPALVRSFAEVGTRKDDPRKPHALRRIVYGAGVSIAMPAVLVGVIVAGALCLVARTIYAVPGGSIGDVNWLVFLFGSGIAIRWLGDPASALLQTSGYLALDNLIQTTAELLWPVVFAFELLKPGADPLMAAGLAYAVCGLVLALARCTAARYVDGVGLSWGRDPDLRRQLLITGSLITLAQLADYLYSPTDYLLINHLLTPVDLANYAPAVQVDGGLMVLVSGLAAVLLPRAAVAHVAGDRARVRRYYVLGTLATGAMLAMAGVFVWAASRWVFRLWLHDSMPGTRAILPLVLVHTVIGGSSAVGRSILLGIGKARPLTVAVLIAGGVNVACSYAFVRYLHWGLAGIVLGTIVAVVGRCAVWMPWYVLRELRRGDVREGAIDENRGAMVIDSGA